MSSVFTEFVRQLQPDAPELTTEHLEVLWDALRGILAVEMKRRSVWSSPPRFLGVVGRTTWTEPGDETDALDELAAECYEFIFVRRLQSLTAQAEEKPEIDGLVLLAVRHFLLETQKRHDPLGFRVFEILRDLVRGSVDAGRLTVLAGPEKVHNGTLIGIAEGIVDPAERVDPAPLVEEIVQRHLVGLVVASHRALGELKGEISETLLEFLLDTSKPLRFGDLVHEIKIRVRAAWATQIEGLPSVVAGSAEGRAVEPRGAQAFEARRRLDKIVRCVEAALRQLEAPKKTRTYLELLWRYVMRHADVRAEMVAPEEDPGAASDDDHDGALPSHRRLSELLGIPRGRLPGLFEMLGERVTACRDRLDSSGDPTLMASGSQHPRDRALAAARATRQSSDPRIPIDDRSPFVPGDLCHVRAAASAGTAWLVVATVPGATGERLRLVAVDTCPLLGPVDRMIADFVGGVDVPWIARPEHRVTLAATTFGILGARRIDRLPSDAFQALRSAIEQRSDGASVDVFPADGELPAYREHIETGPGDARHRLEALSRSSETAERPSRPTPSRRRASIRRHGAWLLAATLALAVVGLGLRVRELDRLIGPILDPASAEIAFDLEPRGPRPLARPDRSHIYFVLVPPATQRAEAYRIEILDAAGHEIYASPSVAAFEPTVVVPLDALRDDPIYFRLYGRVDGEEVLLDEQAIEWIE